MNQLFDKTIPKTPTLNAQIVFNSAKTVKNNEDDVKDYDNYL